MKKFLKQSIAMDFLRVLNSRVDNSEKYVKREAKTQMEEVSSAFSANIRFGPRLGLSG